VSGSFGSVQRTSRRNRSLKDEEEVLDTLEKAGIEPERVLSVDRDKVDDALEVTELSEQDVPINARMCGRQTLTKIVNKPDYRDSKTNLQPLTAKRPKNSAKRSRNSRGELRS
jgi:hypothetical protein